MRKLAVLFALAVVLNVSHSAAQVSPYSVGGLALGAKVAFGSAAYREYQCVRSEKFEAFGRVADDSDEFSMPARLRSQNAEAVLCIVERDPLDETRQHFLGR
jgi:hypothetical protein